MDIKTKILSSKGRNLKSTGLYQIDEMVIVEILINVCEAMGANVVNTVVEKISPYIQEITGARVGIKILSNLCTYRKTYSEFTIPVADMGWKNADGETVAQRIIESYRFA